MPAAICALFALIKAGRILLGMAGLDLLAVPVVIAILVLRSRRRR